MSTEHQQYSTQNQSKTIREYAERRGIEIIKTYSDDAKSGLIIGGRRALQQMISDVESGSADYRVILVYDVTRWGRFQDADESAYYEYRCRKAGMQVAYCAEQFENDGSPTSTIVKSVKRAMAGEYSRELSVKVFAGQCRLIELGYRQGGPAGFGLRRALLNERGEVKAELKRGEHKSLQTDRVILVPGPEEEQRVVRRMFEMFVNEGRPEREIAEILNAEGHRTDLERPWTRATVHQVLTNEKYIGNNVFNKVSFKLKQRRVVNPRDMWIRAEGAYQAIVDKVLFLRAREIVDARSRHFSDEELLDALRAILKRQGQLSGLIIDEENDLPSSSAFRSRFGSLLRAYRLIGYEPERDYRYIEINKALRAAHPQIVEEIVEGVAAQGGCAVQALDTQLLRVNDEFTVSVVLARCQATAAGSLRWHIRLDTGLVPDITIAVRMNETNDAPRDFYLLPSIDMTDARLKMAEQNGLWLDAYRTETLDDFYALAGRAKVTEAA
ncbi:MAG: recombinase family protein [Pacificimonas sp.]|jgi:DNA invertase Pin-like site-specific DNA recombinase|nr:recombinase family protein [Pacificimonas sp.]